MQTDVRCSYVQIRAKRGLSGWCQKEKGGAAARQTPLGRRRFTPQSSRDHPGGEAAHSRGGERLQQHLHGGDVQRGGGADRRQPRSDDALSAVHPAAHTGRHQGQHAREETGAGFYEQAGGAGDRRFGSAGRRGASTPPTPPSATSPSVFSPCSDSSAPPSA